EHLAVRWARAMRTPLPQLNSACPHAEPAPAATLRSDRIAAEERAYNCGAIGQKATARAAARSDGWSNTQMRLRDLIGSSCHLSGGFVALQPLLRWCDDGLPPRSHTPKHLGGSGFADGHLRSGSDHSVSPSQ